MNEKEDHVVSFVEIGMHGSQGRRLRRESIRQEVEPRCYQLGSSS
jgi:hypothetical protein